MSFLKDLIGKLAGEKTADFEFLFLPSQQPPLDLATDSHYVRISLRAARITDVRKWTTKYSPVVHARFNFIERRKGEQEVLSVVAPNKVFEALDAAHAERLIVLDQPLLGPVPYRGGMELEIGLFSFGAADLAQPYLELLGDLSKAAGVAFISQIEPFLAPLRRGAELLFDQNRSVLEIGIALGQAQWQAGTYVVARVPKGTLAPGAYSLDAKDYKLLDKNRQPAPFPYFVFAVEALEQRADYARIPDVRDGWESVRSVASEGRPPGEVRQRFNEFRRRVWLCADLLAADKPRILDIFSREIAGAGYDVAAPLEMAGLEGMPRPRLRPLPGAEQVLAVLSPPAAGLQGAAFAEGVRAAAAPRISVAELQRKMRDPGISDEELRPYFTAAPNASRPFAPSIIPNPDTVDVAAPGDGLEGAMMMDWANSWARSRRKREFKRRLGRGDSRPILVSEGDSWFQFPIMLKDVIDNVDEWYNVWSVDSAGDTLQNMVLDNAEYMQALREHKGKVRAFLFSGGGNDVVGEDAQGNSIIGQIVRPFEAGRPVEWYLDTDGVREKLDFIESCYRQVVGNVAREFPSLPILCHGYDRAIPGGAPGDPRHAIWASQDEWMGKAMREQLHIADPALRRAIVSLLIDRFNERIQRVCGGNNAQGAFRNAWHVDVRGTLSELRHWADELHPTDASFVRVAALFRDVLEQAGVAGVETESVAGRREPTVVDPGHDAAADAVALDENALEAADVSSLEGVSNWRVAASLLQLRQQINTRFPLRSKASDGTIGDPSHQTRASDHNPWIRTGNTGVVSAMDITHDKANGCDGEWLATQLRNSRDSRIKYIIWNRRICNASPIGEAAAWEWRAYTGSNGHTHHVHLSVQAEPALYDSAAAWDLGA
ncbi:hypothetical protein DFR29_114134 [Tahibacter aquaticus]|uniref:GDSL-like lipase/acylhydrolase family protein n=1 Tax=Tahibacter aquaticus TaxID=520092 RepID=A0A4R6YQS3_9GAMM|nr:hypothetical protein [Tahibacter aquaticus]TDR40082.1 hypothetical protein DFR29_114134 [Tahibacter aquaticus]